MRPPDILTKEEVEEEDKYIFIFKKRAITTYRVIAF